LALTSSIFSCCDCCRGGNAKQIARVHCYAAAGVVPCLLAVGFVAIPLVNATAGECTDVHECHLADSCKVHTSGECIEVQECKNRWEVHDQKAYDCFAHQQIDPRGENTRPCGKKFYHPFDDPEDNDFHGFDTQAECDEEKGGEIRMRLWIGTGLLLFAITLTTVPACGTIFMVYSGRVQDANWAEPPVVVVAHGANTGIHTGPAVVVGLPVVASGLDPATALPASNVVACAK